MRRSKGHQSLAMACSIKFASVLLACFSFALGVPTPFPHGKTLIYNYYGDVKAGIIEPAAYASQYALSGQLYVKHETSDPLLTNAYYAVLKNVKMGLHNGVADHYQRTKVLTPIPEAANSIQEPFLIVYSEKGQLQGVKIPDSEAGWSKNMKLAIVSMLQLDLANMKLEMPMKPHSFMTKENTIHGDCYMDYDVQEKDPSVPELANEFIVTKFGSPMNCSSYNVHMFNHVDDEGCEIMRERPVNMASRRMFELKNENGEIVIRKLVAHGGVNYFPYRGRSEAHYVLNNATFVLDKIVASLENELPNVDFESIPLTSDLSYQRPHGSMAATDLTQGRHSVQQHLLIVKLKKMLEEAADYLEENHLNAEEPDYKHGQTINRILYTMSHMEIASFDRVFDEIAGTSTQRDEVIKNIFVGMIPQVGTSASSIFAKNLIMKKRINSLAAVELLTKLPMNVRAPTQDLLVDMESMIKFDDSVPQDIQKASILCFSTLIFRTFKTSPLLEQNSVLNRYLDHFYDRLLNEPTYEMKIVYLMAIRNVQVGKVLELLTPIIRGDIQVSENPIKIRLMSIWTIQKSLPNYNIAHDLLWPVMSNKNNPLKMRIAAYDILIRQAPSMTNILHIYWFMVYESNQHLYNYHHTTIKGLANSVDPCEIYLRELTTKIMRFTKIHDPVSYRLSASYMLDSMDEVYGHGEKFRASMTLQEDTGIPEVIHLEHVVIEGRKRISDWTLQLQVEGVGKASQYFFEKSLSQNGISDVNVLELLKKVAGDNPDTKELQIDVILLRKGRVIMANHYNKQSMNKLVIEVQKILKESVTGQQTFHKQIINYDNIYEQQVVSDMGLPIVMETRIPVVSSLKLNFLLAPVSTVMNMKLELDARIWRHGDYSMSIYNPMVDVWHSVRRSTATDVSAPLNVILALNPGSSLAEIVYPILSATKSTTAGFRTHAKDCTTVTEDEKDTLKKDCPTCSYNEVVTRGLSKKMRYQEIENSKDLGLQLTNEIFDCENEISPALLSREFYRALLGNKNSWNDRLVRLFFAVRQSLKNNIISPQMGSCGRLMKIEASELYPTSFLRMNWRANFERLNSPNPPLNMLDGKKINIRGNLDALEAPSNVSSRSWDMNLNLEMSPGHLLNTLKVQLTRITPGEKNLKICIDGQKIYQEIPSDPLRIGLTKEETNTKLIISIANTNENKCTRDETFIAITIKGELSDEQKKIFITETISGQCSLDIRNPLYMNSGNFVPKTPNCIDETMKHTTLRKYTINVSHKEVPQVLMSNLLAFEDRLRTTLLPVLNYTKEVAEPGMMTIRLVFPMKDESLDLSVVKPAMSWEATDVNEDDFPPRHIGFGPDPEKHLWNFPLDNTRFPMLFLQKYTKSEIKLCSLFPKIVSTLDGGEVHFEIPNEWILATGDFLRKDFAVFVKNSGDRLAVRIYVEDHIVEIMPNEGDTLVTLDNKVLDKIEDGLYVLNRQGTNWILLVTRSGENIAVRLNEQPVMLVHSQNSVVLSMESHLQGTISGICGQINGEYKTKIPKTYQLSS